MAWPGAFMFLRHWARLTTSATLPPPPCFLCVMEIFHFTLLPHRHGPNFLTELHFYILAWVSQDKTFPQRLCWKRYFDRRLSDTKLSYTKLLGGYRAEFEEASYYHEHGAVLSWCCSICKTERRTPNSNISETSQFLLYDMPCSRYHDSCSMRGHYIGGFSTGKQ